MLTLGVKKNIEKAFIFGMCMCLGKHRAAEKKVGKPRAAEEFCLQQA
jgi:hypothetical protein